MFPIDLYFWDNYIMFNLIALKSNPTSPRIIVAFIYSHTFNLNNFGAKIVFECFFRIYSNNQSTLQTRTLFGISKALLQHVLFLFNSMSKPMYDRYSEIAKLRGIVSLIYFLELRSVWSNEKNMTIQISTGCAFGKWKDASRKYNWDCISKHRNSSPNRKVLISLNLIHLSVVIRIFSVKDNRNKPSWTQPIG